MSMPKLAPLVLIAAFTTASALAGCGLIPKKVSKDDCKAWAEHTAEVTKKEIGKALKKCDDDTAKQVRKQLNKALDSGQKDAVASCTQQAEAGARVVTKEADCFMKGNSLSDWKACQFTMDTFKTDSFDSALSQIQSLCKDSQASDDDDDSKTKKSKKAKSSDDDN